MASAPLTRTTARPAAPGAVAIAAITSSSAYIHAPNERRRAFAKPGARWSPARKAGVAAGSVRSRALGVDGGGHRDAFDEPGAERVGLDPRVLPERHVHDAALLR